MHAESLCSADRRSYGVICCRPRRVTGKIVKEYKGIIKSVFGAECRRILSEGESL